MWQATRRRLTSFGNATATSSASMMPHSRPLLQRHRAASHRVLRRLQPPPTARGRRGLAKRAPAPDALNRTARPVSPTLRRPLMAEIDLLTVEDRVRLLVNALGGERDHFPVVKLFTPDAGATWLITECDPD